MSHTSLLLKSLKQNFKIDVHALQNMFLRRCHILKLFMAGYTICLDKLPDKDVTCAMKSFGKNVQALMIQQGKEHQQKRKVDGLARKYPRRVLAFEIMKSILQLKFLRRKCNCMHKKA
ncbi:unnamed protein product [Prunus armeniaca]|uniref:Uncharacterized protein n=1 Tax=Prunus armeniaca TaxID=36596 RepID=A0A6J5XAS6_PRUAR|nr:unnamed protein product [Prunus armeniaca]